MTVRESRCACGALSARAEGEPERISVCHCLDCKRRSGAAFSWNATYRAEHIQRSGAASAFTRVSDDGYSAQFHFCPRCGVTVWYEIERRPGMISIPAGGFSDPAFPAPSVEVYVERRCPWLPDIAPEQQW